MRILVLSDSHGDAYGVKEIIRREPKAEVVIFCGDGEQDFNTLSFDFPDKAFYMVRGNCDFASTLDTVKTINIEGVKILFAHGHTFDVKCGTENIIFAAREAKAQIVIFGHTHKSISSYDNGIYILNPGSCRGSFGTYGTIDLANNGILLNVLNRT